MEKAAIQAESTLADSNDQGHQPKDDMALIQVWDHTALHSLTFDDAKHSYTLNGEHVPGVTTFTHGGYPTSEGLISWMKGQTADAMFGSLTKVGEDGYYPAEAFWPINETRRKLLVKEAKLRDKKSSQEAADIGTLVHDYAYQYELQGAPSNELLETVAVHKDSEKIMRGMDKFREWKKENHDEIIATETTVGSVVHQFGGKFDRLARRGVDKDLLVLSDFKTSNAIYLDHFIQLGAYALAIEEWMGLKVGGFEILRFGKENGEFQTLLVTRHKELETFKNQAIRCRQTYEFRKLENDKRWRWGGKR